MDDDDKQIDEQDQINNNLIGNLRLEIIDSFKNKFENNKKYENNQKSLIDLYENTIAKLNNDLIEAQEELNKEKAESGQLNAQNDLFENELQVIEDNIHILNEKYEEEINRNKELNKVNEKYKKEINEKNKKIEILEKNNKELQKNIDIIKEKDSKIKELNEELDKKEKKLKTKKSEIKKSKEDIKKMKDDYEVKLKAKDEEITNLLKQIQNYEMNNSNKNGEEIEKYKKELKIKEEEIKNNLSKTSQIKEQFNRIIEATKEEYKNKLEKFEKDIKKKVEEWKEKTEKEFEDKYNEKEKNYNSKFNELKNLIKNQKWNKNENNDDIDNDYDSDSDNDIDDINNNEIREDKNEIIIEKNEEYSYECINKRDLKLNIDEDDDFSKFEIALKNNGKKKWHKDTILKIAGDSEDIKTKIINLKPQEPEETGVYRIDFNYLKEYISGEYRMYLEFYSGGNNYGERLEMRVNTVKKEEVNKNIEKIKEFRNLFGFREKDYSNAFLLRKLKENNFNFEKAHNSIFKK